MSEPKERPIIFSGEMIRAILDGRKTMTRRVIKPQPDAPLSRIENSDLWTYTLCEQEWRCPYGVPGDRLWVKETWRPVQERYPADRFIEYREDDGYTAKRVDADFTNIRGVALRFEGANQRIHSEAWHSPIHMPRWASRITLEVTGIRVERVREISEADAIAEGFIPQPADCALCPKGICSAHPPAIGQFALLWDSLQTKRGYGWNVNPWCWVVEFRRIKS